MNFRRYLYLILGILSGIFFAGFFSSLILYLIIFVLGIFSLLLNIIQNKKVIIGFLFLGLIIGSSYFYIIDSYAQKKVNIEFNKEKQYCGEIFHDLKIGSEYDRADLNLTKNGNGKIKLYLLPYSNLNYGDEVCFTTKISEEKYQQKYFAGSASVYEIEKIGEKGSKLKKLLYSFKEKIISSLKKSLSTEGESLVSGIILGDDNRLSKENQEAMKKAGLTHITALSGYNVSIIISTILPIFFFLPKKFRFLGISIIIFLFAVMTGAEASILRASFMAILIFAGKHFERASSSFYGLSLAGLLIAIFDIYAPAFDLGFQLSFLAFLGIGWLSPKIQKLISLKSGFLSMVIDTASAQIMVLPVLALKFGRMSLWPIIPNIFVLGLVPLLTFLGFLTGFLGIISPVLNFPFAIATDFLAKFILDIVKIFAGLSIFN